MGNRAVIRAYNNNNKAVYLHWNGGRDSVEAFLKYCELKGYRSFEDDYGMARFCQVVGNFFGGSLSIGITDYVQSAGDNGVYVVKGWEIVDREGFTGCEQRKHNLLEMLKAIDKAQPVKEQLGDFITAEEIKTSTIKVGDVVYMQELNGEYKKYEVVGIGEDKFVNGINVLGMPYVNRFLNDGSYANNCNNYIREKTVRKCV